MQAARGLGGKVNVLGLVTRRLATVTSIVAVAAFCSGLPASAGSAAAYGPSAIQAAASGTIWGTAEEVPGTASLNTGGLPGAQLSSLSCASSGNCGGGGYYTDSSGNTQAFVATEVNGTWGNAIEVPGTAALNTGWAQLSSLSCASSGNCGGGGYYTDSSRNSQAFVVSEVNGVWGNAQDVPGLAALGIGQSSVGPVSCLSAGNCTAAGSSSNGQAFFVSEVNGVWGNAQVVQGFAALNGGDTGVYELSCQSAGNCTAGGDYVENAATLQVFVVDEVNGTWGNAIKVPGTAALNTGGYAEMHSLACSSAGNCSAGGYYLSGGQQQQAFVATEVNGTWGNATEVPGTAALNTGGDAELSSLSCVSAGNCSGGGYYRDSSGDSQAFVVGEVNGTWGNAIEAPGTAALNTGGGAEMLSLACSSAGNCSAGGFYSSPVQQAFVATEVNGTWGNAIEVPGTAALNTGTPGAEVDLLSCPSAGSCSAGGHYTDSSNHQQVFVVGEQQSSASATALNLSAATVTYGYEQAEKVSVTVSSAGTPTGTVAVSAGATTLCTITLVSAAGSCTLRATALPAGTYHVTGSYSGDASASPSTSPAQTLTVSKAGSATALNLSAATVTYGYEQAEKVSVTVSSAGTPTGTVAVSAGATTLCTITLVSAAGSCTLRATALPAGTYHVTGSYSGDANASPSTSPAQTLTIQPTSRTTATLTSTAYVTAVNHQVIYTAQVSPTPDGGTVAFTDNGVKISGCGAVALSSGAASCPDSYGSPGTHTIAATYSGDAAFAGSVSEKFPITVVKTPPSSLRWGYCSGFNADVAFQIGLTSYSLLCLVEDTGTGNVEMMAYQASGPITQPQNPTQFAEDLDSVLSSCAGGASASADAIALEAPASTDVGSETYATVTAQANVSLDLFHVSFDAGAEATMLQSRDQTTWGLVYGGDFGAGVACPDPLPVKLTASAQNAETFASFRLQGTATTPGTAAYLAAGALSLAQTGFAASCASGIALGHLDLISCGLGSVQLLGPTAVSSVEQLFPGIYLDAQGGQSAPPCQASSCAQSSPSTTNSGLASATIDNFTAAATGVGLVTVSHYSSNPLSQSPPLGGAAYFDVASSAGNLFSTVSVADCNLAGGNKLYWWNPSANGGNGTWQIVSDQTKPSGSPACISATINLQTSPSVLQLAGTVFASAFVPSQACITAKRNGSLTVASGQAVCVTTGGIIHGPVTIQSGGAFWMAGGTVTGPLVSENALTVRLCGASLTGPVRIRATTGAVIIGDPAAACPANTIHGPVDLTSNTGSVELAGNTVTGAVAVTGNTRFSPVIGANDVTGTLSCSGNNPPPVNGGEPNTVTGRRSGQCSAL